MFLLLNICSGSTHRFVA